MKQIFKFLVLPLLIGTISCRAQMVQTTNDLNKLIINKNQFIGKPLSDLLQQIKPPIKRAMVFPGSIETNSYFYFVSDSDFHKYWQEEKKTPPHIRVMVKEYNFNWDKPKEHWNDWTKEDEKEYGNLTVVDIRVTGSN